MFDQSSVTSLLMALFAGFSTLIGAVLVIITGKRNEKLTTIALGFAAGVMISVAFTDMMPEALEYFELVLSSSSAKLWSVAFLAVGILLAAIADRLIPHHCAGGCSGAHHCHEDDMARLGVVTMIATGLHNFPEGIAMFIAGYEDTTLGVTLAIAVALHNIPGGITVAMPVYYSTGSKIKALGYALVPSVIQPLAALLACLFLKNIMGDFAMGAMFSVVGGFLLFIALVELYPATRNYGHRGAGVIATFAGVVIMQLVELIH
jgi:ZIP family zinc transporter